MDYMALMLNYLKKRRVCVWGGEELIEIRQAYLFEASNSVVAKGLGKSDVKNE